MELIHRHVVAIAVAAAALVATASVFAFARPAYHPHVLPAPPSDLPYSSVTYTLADVQRAFAHDRLVTGRTPPAAQRVPIRSLRSRDYAVEVDVFGAPDAVEASGFHDYFTIAGGHWVKAPRDCAASSPDAERWRGNVRVVVSCTRAGSSSGVLLAHLQRELASL